MRQGGEIGAGGWWGGDVSARRRDRFRELVERHVLKLRVRGSKATGLCPFHPDTTPSLSLDLEQCVWHCFGCGAGGGVKDFAERVGEGWEPLTPASPYRDSAAYRRQRADRAALADIEAEYEAWCRAKFLALSDQYRALLGLQVLLTPAYEASHGCPTRDAPPGLSYWSSRLAEVYHALPQLEYDLDILTYREHEAARLDWWLEETAHGTEGERGAVSETPAVPRNAPGADEWEGHAAGER
jgi:CHC2 zinc finger